MCAARQQACVWLGEMVETIQSRCSSHNRGGIIFYNRTGCLQMEGKGGILWVVQDTEWNLKKHSEKMGFPGGLNSKESASMRETWIRSLGQEDPLEKEIATHSIILTWRIPWTEKPGGLQSMGSQRVISDTTVSEGRACFYSKWRLLGIYQVMAPFSIRVLLIIVPMLYIIFPDLV